MNRLAKYYNQEINMKNMKIKISSLKEKSKETTVKTDEAFVSKEVLMKEIAEIMRKYQEAVEKFKERAEYKNVLLDNHIGLLNEQFESKDYEIDDLLRRVDQIANDERSGFSRDNVKNFMEEIKHTLVTKTQIIKSLKFSISKATKVIV